MAHKRDLRFLEIMLLQRSLMVASGRTDKKFNDLLQDYVSEVFPDTNAEREDMGKKVEDIMKRELARGPMKVQSTEYSRKGRRRKS